MQVRVGSSLSDYYDQDQGVPQGGVLSTTLFSIKINDIVKCLGNLTDCSLYVDDFCICYRSKSTCFELRGEMMKCEISSVADTVKINLEGNNALFSTTEAELMLLELNTTSKTSKERAHTVQTDFEITMKDKAQINEKNSRDSLLFGFSLQT